jgi:hypothetical protein
MDTLGVLQQLREERQNLDAVIFAMERLAFGMRRGRPPKGMKDGAVKKRGRPPGSRNKPKGQALEL